MPVASHLRSHKFDDLFSDVPWKPYLNQQRYFCIYSLEFIACDLYGWNAKFKWIEFPIFDFQISSQTKIVVNLIKRNNSNSKMCQFKLRLNLIALKSQQHHNNHTRTEKTFWILKSIKSMSESYRPISKEHHGHSPSDFIDPE